MKTTLLSSILAAAALFARAVPVIGDLSVSDTAARQTTLSATLGEPAAVTILYGPSASDLWQSEDLGECAAGPVSGTVYTLLPGRTYVFRLVATNAGGTAESDPVAVTTPSATPSHPRYSGGWYDGWACSVAACVVPRAGFVLFLR